MAAERLLAALDEAGIVYTIRHTPQGTPYAGFKLQCPPAQRVHAFTALLDDAHLRLTLHGGEDVPGLATQAGRWQAQDDFPVARLVSGPDGRPELTIAIDVAQARWSYATLEALMHHMAANYHELVDQTTGASRQAPRVGDSWQDFQIKTALEEINLHPFQEAGAQSFDLALPDSAVEARLSVYHLGPGWLRIAGRLPGNDPLALDRLPPGMAERLQDWAPVGRYVRQKSGKKLSLGVEVAMPLLERMPIEAMIRALRASVFLLDTACEQATKANND